MSNNIKLICFDLDGTLYKDNIIYLNMIDHFYKGTGYEAWIDGVKERIEKILKGSEPWKCGQFLPKRPAHEPKCIDDLFDEPSATALLMNEEDRAEYLDRSKYSYLCDGWTYAMYLCRRIGYEGDVFWDRFRLSREELIGDEFGPARDAELRQILLDLKAEGIQLVLCSNAQEAGCIGLLKKLELYDVFDKIICDADKPHTMKDRIDAWGYKPEELLFIGDQGYFDLYPGKNCGAHTVLVSSAYVDDAELWETRLRDLSELKSYLKNICNK